MAKTQHSPHIQDLIAARMDRRDLLRGLAGLPLLTLAGCATSAEAASLSFEPVKANMNDMVTVPAGYEVKTLIAWGDALFENVDAKFDPNALTRAEQESRFGQNNDMLALFPAEWAFPKRQTSERYILCANNEYVDPALMFPAVASPTDFTADQVAAMYAAMGVSIVQLEERRGDWRIIKDAAPGAGRNRRITPFTPMMFTGPARNHPWIRAAAAFVNAQERGAPEGTIACGTMANCAGGETPWGTYLSAEENFNTYFVNTDPLAEATVSHAAGPGGWDSQNYGYPLANPLQRPGTPAQFDTGRNPTCPALYGWIVEIDPYDPSWTPRKRTALGRRKAECATTALTRDGRVAVYSGDDQLDEFVYKFISRGRFNRNDRKANLDLLDQGQLYAARFNADGTGQWLPLTLAAANAAVREIGYPNAFADDGDLMIRAREAANLLGATPMDRPEDVEALTDPNWVGQGPVLVVCTKNIQSIPARPGNPRRGEGSEANLAGHIIRIDEDGGDVGATTFKWGVFAMAGDPNSAAATAKDRRNTDFRPGVAETFRGDRFACPDNICFDSSGNVFIATDGSDDVFPDCHDSVLITPLNANGPRPVKRFLTGPVGAEICGPMLSPDERSFFAAIQHPGEQDAKGNPYSAARWGAGAKAPSSFPDGGGAWPRSAVVVVRRKDGRRITS